MVEPQRLERSVLRAWNPAPHRGWEMLLRNGFGKRGRPQSIARARRAAHPSADLSQLADPLTDHKGGRPDFQALFAKLRRLGFSEGNNGQVAAVPATLLARADEVIE